MAQFWLKRRRCSLKSVQLRSDLVDQGRVWPRSFGVCATSVEVGPNLARVGPMFGRLRPDAGQIRPTPNTSRRNRTKCASSSKANSMLDGRSTRRKRLHFARVRPLLGEIRRCAAIFRCDRPSLAYDRRNVDRNSPRNRRLIWPDVEQKHVSTSARNVARFRPNPGQRRRRRAPRHPPAELPDVTQEHVPTRRCRSMTTPARSSSNAQTLRISRMPARARPTKQRSHAQPTPRGGVRNAYLDVRRT